MKNSTVLKVLVVGGAAGVVGFLLTAVVWQQRSITHLQWAVTYIVELLDQQQVDEEFAEIVENYDD